MSDTPPPPHALSGKPPAWKAVPRLERRILGVLVEKAKTTPEQYPLSLNALRSGCNQKNNRDPLMELELEDLQTPLDNLKAIGAIAEVMGGGRVSKFRHYLYEWLGVDKVELAVMAELLLRGPQTEGELRGRAARMEAIPDLAALRPVLASLKEKGLVTGLSPEGRGHVVTHMLFTAAEMDRIKNEFANYTPAEADDGPAPAPRAPRESAPSAASEVAELRRQVDKLQDLYARLLDRVEALEAASTPSP